MIFTCTVPPDKRIPIMIDFSNVYKHFGTQDILVNASFRINSGEQVGIVGPNGTGKSTLFRLICQEISPDRGDIILQNDLRMGYLRQQLNAHSVKESLLDYTSRSIPELLTLQQAIHTIEEQLQVTDADHEARLNQLGSLQLRFEHLGGYEMETRAEKALCGLGFHAQELQQPFQSFSGGWQMRAELARTLIGQPDLLLLDEPSNYLDVPAVEWLKNHLRAFHGTMLLISHDRYLLESLTQITLECQGGAVTRYPGGYSYYLRERTARREHLLAAKMNQDRKREQIERFVERFRSKSTKASQVQSRIKQLEKMETIQLPKALSSMAGIRLPNPPHCGSEAVALCNAGFTYDQKRWIFRDINLHIERGKKIALVGYNGMGKTTLLRLLAGATSPTEGTCRLGHQVVVGYQSQEFAETMAPAKTLFQLIKETAPERSDGDVHALLGSFGFSGDAVQKQVEVLSGGEKIRLAFAHIFARPPNLLILDEPTTHLDIDAREALEQALRDFTGTVCFVSHDITFIRHTAEEIIAVTDSGIQRFCGNYDYYCEKCAAPPPSGTSKAASAVDLKKMDRKQRSVQKQQTRQQKLALRKEVRTAEQQIELLETEQAALLEKMADPEQTDYAAINKALTTVQQKIEEWTTAWETASIELEELESS